MFSKILNPKWSSCAKRSQLPTVALTLVLALSLHACALTKQTASGQTALNVADSTVRVTTTIRTQTIPPRTATLRVPLSSLLALPDSAIFQTQNQNASASLALDRSSPQAPAIIIKAHCDSLAALVSHYQRLEKTHKTENLNTHSTQTTKAPPPITAYITAFALGCAAGPLVRLLIRLIKPKIP